MEGYSERQEDEIEFLQAVFPAGELEDLRLKDPWKVSWNMIFNYVLCQH